MKRQSGRRSRANSRRATGNLRSALMCVYTLVLLAAVVFLAAEFASLCAYGTLEDPLAFYTVLGIFYIFGVFVCSAWSRKAMMTAAIVVPFGALMGWLTLVHIEEVLPQRG